MSVENPRHRIWSEGEGVDIECRGGGGKDLGVKIAPSASEEWVSRSLSEGEGAGVEGRGRGC